MPPRSTRKSPLSKVALGSGFEANESGNSPTNALRPGNSPSHEGTNLSFAKRCDRRLRQTIRQTCDPDQNPLFLVFRRARLLYRDWCGWRLPSIRGIGGAGGLIGRGGSATDSDSLEDGELRRRSRGPPSGMLQVVERGEISSPDESEAAGGAGGASRGSTALESMFNRRGRGSRLSTAVGAGPGDASAGMLEAGDLGTGPSLVAKVCWRCLHPCFGVVRRGRWGVVSAVVFVVFIIAVLDPFLLYSGLLTSLEVGDSAVEVVGDAPVVEGDALAVEGTAAGGSSAAGGGSSVIRTRFHTRTAGSSSVAAAAGQQQSTPGDGTTTTGGASSDGFASAEGAAPSAEGAAPSAEGAAPSAEGISIPELDASGSAVRDLRKEPQDSASSSSRKEDLDPPPTTPNDDVEVGDGDTTASAQTGTTARRGRHDGDMAADVTAGTSDSKRSVDGDLTTSAPASPVAPSSPAPGPPGDSNLLHQTESPPPPADKTRKTDLRAPDAPPVDDLPKQDPEKDRETLRRAMKTVGGEEIDAIGVAPQSEGSVESNSKVAPSSTPPVEGGAVPETSADRPPTVPKHHSGVTTDRILKDTVAGVVVDTNLDPAVLELAKRRKESEPKNHHAGAVETKSTDVNKPPRETSSLREPSSQRGESPPPRPDIVDGLFHTSSTGSSSTGSSTGGVEVDGGSGAGGGGAPSGVFHKMRLPFSTTDNTLFNYLVGAVMMVMILVFATVSVRVFLTVWHASFGPDDPFRSSKPRGDIDDALTRSESVTSAEESCVPHKWTVFSQVKTFLGRLFHPFGGGDSDSSDSGGVGSLPKTGLGSVAGGMSVSLDARDMLPRNLANPKFVGLANTISGARRGRSGREQDCSIYT